jgi:hypothetical protein
MMMMMSALYYTNTFGWIFIGLTTVLVLTTVLDEMMMDDVCFILDQHVWLDLYSANNSPV